jgi:proline iminopeptidase
MSNKINIILFCSMFYKMKAFLTSIIITFIFTGCSNNSKNNLGNQIQLSTGYVEVEEGKLFYQKFGSGEPIIILHGGPGLDQNYLLPQMLELAKDHELIFYDQRGSGRSLDASIDPKYVTLDQFTEDLEQLRLSLGLKKFIILGHSWGGLLAMNYSVKHSANVSSLILLSSAPADSKGQKSFLDEFAIKTKPVIHKIPALFNDKEFAKLNARQINQLYRDLFSVYFENHLGIKKLTLTMNKKSAVSGAKVNAIMSKTSLLKFNLFPSLRKLNIPTLIIHGNQDIVPVSTATEIKEAIPGSEIIYLDNCNHFPYIEKPTELFRSIRNFLAKVKNR